MGLKDLGYDKDYRPMIKIEKVANKYFVQIGVDCGENDEKIYNKIDTVKKIVNRMLEDFEELEEGD
jgi:hypothetical protein